MHFASILVVLSNLIGCKRAQHHPPSQGMLRGTSNLSDVLQSDTEMAVGTVYWSSVLSTLT